MNITKYQINLYIIFFLTISIISLYYVNTNTNKIELFDGQYNIPETPEEAQAVAEFIAKYKYIQDTTDSIENKQIDIPNISTSTPDIIIDDTSIQNIANKYIKEFSDILDNYNNIDAPITINNNNKICDYWGTYNNSKYKSKDNQCLIMDGKTDTSCLSNKKLISCSNYYDNTINSLNIIDTNQILNTTITNINNNNNITNNTFKNVSKEFNMVIDDIVSKKNTESQQLYFIEYNKINLNDKQKFVDKTTEEFEKAENNLNINQLNFSVFLEKNNNNDSQKNFYYKILMIIIIIIIIVGILNLIFTEF